MKKELLIPILILALTIAFAVVSAMVFLNGGKSEKLIRRKLKLATLLLTFNAMIWGAKAQEESSPLYGVMPVTSPIYLGAEISLNHNSGKDLVLNKLSKEPIADYNSHGFGYSAGVFYQHFFKSWSEPKHSLIVSLNYTSSVMSVQEPIFNTIEYIEPFLDNINKPYKVIGTVEHEFQTVDFKILYNYRLFGDLSISLGPSFLFVTENTLTEKVSFDENLLPTVHFRDDLNPLRLENNHSAILSEGDPVDSKWFHLGFSVDIRYDISMSRDMTMAPYAGINHIITSITKNSDWGVLYVYLGAAFRFGL